MAKSTKPYTPPPVPIQEPTVDWFCPCVLGLALAAGALGAGMAINKRLNTHKTENVYVQEVLLHEKVCPKCHKGHLKDDGFRLSQVTAEIGSDATWHYLAAQALNREIPHWCQRCGEITFLERQSWPFTTTNLVLR